MIRIEMKDIVEMTKKQEKELKARNEALRNFIDNYGYEDETLKLAQESFCHNTKLLKDYKESIYNNAPEDDYDSLQGVKI
jgi:hypothetical protein